MKLRAYLVDDEPLALKRLQRLLERTRRVEVIGTTTEPEEAVAALTAHPPDVCFLDIHMPRLNGFDVLARLPRQPAVVFTTAYDEYALKAFAVNSVDYLLKPVDQADLDRALAKLESLRAPGASAQIDLHSVLAKIADSLAQPRSEYLERIASRLGDRLRFIDVAQTSHFFAQDKLTYAVAEGKPHSVDYTIAELEKKLDPKKFIRIHRSTLVNVDWIKEVVSAPGGSLTIILKDARQTALPVARDRAAEFRKFMSL